MDSKSVRNIQSSLPNKVEKQCILSAFIIRVYHDARSSECQNHRVIVEPSNVLVFLKSYMTDQYISYTVFSC